tara:strand:- start:1368 stop:1574 length:207 start_codon:yes stop_codon:yes gene_type:complete
MGKGSRQRPSQVSDEKLRNNWDAIFAGVSVENAWQKYIAELAVKEPNRVFSKEEHDSFVKAYKEKNCE